MNWPHFSIVLDRMLPHWFVNFCAWIGLVSCALAVAVTAFAFYHIARHEWATRFFVRRRRSTRRDAVRVIERESRVVRSRATQRARIRLSPLHAARPATLEELMPTVTEIPE